MNLITVSLEFLWDFIGPILGETVKDKIKPKDDHEKAKKVAFHLYETLGEVKEKTDSFVSALRDIVDNKSMKMPEGIPTSEQFPTEPGITPGQIEALRLSARELMISLPKLADSLDKVNPQLDIHRHDLVQNILHYRRYRAEVLTELELSAYGVGNQNADKLREIFNRAEENRKLIDQAIDNFRSFLAAEFPFKESF
jgi:hypothetical protein